jgi:hypothetical protein
MYIRGQEEYEVGFHCSISKQTLKRDTCLAFATAVVFQISRDSYCLRNRHPRLSGECHCQGMRLSGTRLHD